MDWDMISNQNEGLSPEQEGLLAELFMKQFPDPYHNPRMDKARSLYKLAKLAKGGCVVELGTYHGCGAIACAWGTQAAGRHVQVYTVDDYVRKPEWIGNDWYVPEDKGVFLANVERAKVKENVHLIQLDADAAQAWWPSTGHAISLFFWDLGGQRLFDDFVKWHTFVEKGGLFAVHDTGDCKFGFNTVKVIAEAAGAWKFEGQMQGYVYLLRRL